MLSIVTAVLLFLDLDSSEFLLWFYMFYFLIFSLSLYIQSRGRHIFDLIGKSYLKMDNDSIEFKPQILAKKVLKVHWKEIDEVKVKLFETHLKLEDKWEIINLEKLSDDNLKLVKQLFLDFEQKLSQKKLELAS